jgi:hypothetical protein
VLDTQAPDALARGLGLAARRVVIRVVLGIPPAIVSLVAHVFVGAAKSPVTLRSWWSSGSR